MKRIKQCSLAFSVFALALLSSVFLQSLPVSAASAYDDVLQPLEYLKIKSPNGVHELDLTGAIFSEFRVTASCNLTNYDAFMDLYQNENANWIIGKTVNGTFDPGGIAWMQVTTRSDPSLTFTGAPSYPYLSGSGALSSSTAYFAVRLLNDETTTVQCGTGAYTTEIANGTPGVSSNWTQPWLSTIPVNYPEGYQGQTVPDTWAPPGADGELVPDYNWTVSTTGELNVKYMKNLPHFFTGIAYVVIEKMHDNWDGLDENLTSITENPAGWMDSKYTLPSAGYYMVRIDHNQQLDEPPWPVDSNFSVAQRWIQFYWDGSSAIQGTTVGCTDDICNPHRSDNNPVASIFSSLDNIDTFGLTAFVTAPISFLQTLPAKVSSCSPITFPLMGKTISLECLSSRYWSWSSTVMTVVTTIWTGAVAYAVGLSIFRTIKDINSPHKDQIETVKL